MSTNVVVSGMGIISPIGMNVDENLHSLLDKKSGIGRLKGISSRLASSILVGEIPATDDELGKKLSGEIPSATTRTGLMGCIAASEALLSAGIERHTDKGLALISATTVGGMNVTEQHFTTDPEPSSASRMLMSHHAAYSTEVIADYLGVGQNFCTTLSTACSSASNAIMLGSRMIAAGLADKVIAGGSDCLSRFTMNGFNSLMILSDEANRPFDSRRKGLNLGEGAAYVLLESEQSAHARGHDPIALLKGYGNANDAHHQTASSEEGEGAFLAMSMALRSAGIQSNEVDYINAHGTATVNNDMSESRAIERVFEDRLPPISSTKPYTGHTLAAAGGVEAVFSLLAIREQVIWPSLNFGSPMPETQVRPNTEVLPAPVKTVLSNSLGFGGNCSSLIFTGLTS